MIDLARRVLRPLEIRRSTWRAAPEGSAQLVEGTARIGYAVRGLLYMAVGGVTLMAVLFRSVEASSPTSAMAWLAEQRFSWLWLLLLATGLMAFCAWRLLQGLFDIDRKGLSKSALSMRLSQTSSALGYAALCWAALSLALHSPADPDASAVERTHRQAAQVLSLPHGEWILAGIAIAVAGVGLANITRAWREDFTSQLSCSERLCRWLSPVARAGYLARGFSYLPLSAFILIAAIRSRPDDVTSLSGALNALVDEPTGRFALSLAAIGFIAFGLFSVIEARFRRIRVPK